jgi:transaldolase
MSQFEQLGAKTVLVSDTGDIEQVRLLKPTDGTTNPSLILAAAMMPEYQSLVDDAIAYGKTKDSDQLDWTLDRLAVNFGCEILKHVPGVVSTEVDARLSFKPKRTMDKAHRLIKLYEEKGIPKERVLIKVAATWQGIKAAEQLEKEGISCNLTLLFSKEAQAVACAEAGVTLISPFVGRITDWYKKETGKDYTAEEDPGVLSVRSIYQYYKKYGYKTIVMGASFRNKGQVLALCGCDKLTIGPKFLKELQASNDPVETKLAPLPESEVTVDKRPKPLDDRHFYMRMCRDPMAIDKLHEGIRKFVADQVKLEDFVKGKMAKL